MSAFTRRAVLMAGGAAAVLGAVAARPVASAAIHGPLWVDASLPATARADLLLQPDLVAQWRGELRARLRGRGEAVTAIVRWDKAMLLAGLAREEGWKTRTQRLGNGVFRVDVIV